MKRQKKVKEKYQKLQETNRRKWKEKQFKIGPVEEKRASQKEISSGWEYNTVTGYRYR
jgi:hypothetical protein